MGFINSLLGAQQDAMPTQNVATKEQADKAFANTESGLAQQQAFVNALMGQNGIGNQNSVFAQQQALASQLQGQANGQGPNPALAQLNQTTGQNIAGQNALMAGQRGAGANAGLIARQAAQQGGNLQQQAVGQAATLGAQQQIAAEQALMGQQANMANLSTQQIGQQQQGLQAYNQGAQNEQSNLLGGIASQNQINQAAAAQNAKNNAKTGGTIIGTVPLIGSSMAAGGEVKSPYEQMGQLAAPTQPLPQVSADAAGKFAKGLRGYADGGQVNVPNGPQSFAGQYLRSNAGSVGAMAQGPDDSQAPISPEQASKEINKIGSMFGNAPVAADNAASSGALLGGLMGGADAGMGAAAGASAGGIGELLPLLALSRGGQIDGEHYAKKMKPVPGKANKKGDSLANDKVKALLSPGEVIIPRSVMQSQDPVSEAARFVSAVMAKKGRRK